MRKIASLVPIVIACMAVIVSCRIVEVSSAPRIVKIAIIADEPFRYSLHLLNSSGKFDPVTRTGDGFYILFIPRMDGGYTEFGIIKYNLHNPEEYPVILIKKENRPHKELTIRDVENLVKKGDVYQLKID
jgi:hypothetical protein